MGPTGSVGLLLMGGSKDPVGVVVLSSETPVSIIALLSSHVQLLRCRHRASGELDLARWNQWRSVCKK